MKQHKKNKATIMSIIPRSSSEPSHFSSTMTLISDAKRNVIELFYEVNGVVHLVSFETNDVHSISAQTWKQIILEFEGDVAILYVDCHKIGSRFLRSQFYQNFNPDVTKMTLASSNDYYTLSNGHRYDDFKVSFTSSRVGVITA